MEGFGGRGFGFFFFLFGCRFFLGRFGCLFLPRFLGNDDYFQSQFSGNFLLVSVGFFFFGLGGLRFGGGFGLGRFWFGRGLGLGGLFGFLGLGGFL